MTATSGSFGRPMAPKPSLRRKSSRGSILADRAATVVLWGTGVLVLLILGASSSTSRWRRGEWCRQASS